MRLIPPVLFSVLALAAGACDSQTPGTEVVDFNPGGESGELSCSLPGDQLYVSLVKDAVPALLDPPLTEARAATYLDEGDRVLGLAIGGLTLALPHKILGYHEVVNLDITSPPLAVTYCPLTGSGIAFDRRDIRGAEFGVSGLLYRNNLIMYDRNGVESLWPQMELRTRCGPADDGSRLRTYPILDMTWEGWRALYPATKVISHKHGAGLIKAPAFGTLYLAASVVGPATRPAIPLHPIPHEIPMKDQAITRRQFIGRTAASAFGAIILPRHVLGGPGYQAPSDTLNVAAIGAGGMGASNMSNLVSENIVAICDVDDQKLEEAFYNQQGELRESRKALKAAYEKAKRYRDFRKMLEEQSDIEAVVVATPDHVHATAAAMAMRMGKHVYVQKPLTYTIHEARVLTRLARDTGVVTQMGNQGHSHDDGRRLLEWLGAGALGPVHEVHVWTNRPIWPQGLPRPAEPEPVPPTLAWDLWLGPAPEVPYHSAYLPFLWRGWTDWGTGALGDMGAHLIDHAYWALDLKYPASVEASGSPFGGEDKASYPLATLIHYEFAREGGEPVRMSWYDGGLLPPRPPAMPANAEVNPGGGAMLIGEKGVLVYDTYGHNPRLFPQTLAQEYTDVPQTLPRIPESHEMNWAGACKGLNPPSCPFAYAGPLTETMLLGVVALRTGYGRKLFWDGENGRFPNAPEADAFLHRAYRDGWTL